MSKKHTNRKKKVFRIIVIIIVGVLALLALFLCLLAKSYLGKIDYDHDKEASAGKQVESSLTDEEILQQLQEEEVDPSATDSPQEDITQLESQMEQQLQQESEAAPEEETELLNILLVGSDSRQKGGAGRSDTMILISVNDETERIHMTSIMRDCYVAIPDKGNNRINAAYALGGGSLLLDTIETNFAVDVDKYVALDFYAFVDIVDSIGGVEIDVSEAEIPVLNGYVKELNKLNGRPQGTYYVTDSGPQLLNGTQALGYARIRYVGNGDFQRTERRRTVLTKVFEKVRSMNLLEMNKLLNVLLPEIKTNLTETEIVSLMLKVMTYLEYDLDSLRVPIDGSYQNMRINGMSVLGVDLKTNQEAIREFIYN